MNLYMSNEAEIGLNGNSVKITQETEYPYDGKIAITVEPEVEMEFELRLRIPGWARNEAIDGDLYIFRDKYDPNYSIEINGDSVFSKQQNGYLIINRNWNKGDKISLNFPMEVRQVASDERVKADSARFTFQRGPLVYAAEWADNKNLNVLDIYWEFMFRPHIILNDNIYNGTPCIEIEVYKEFQPRLIPPYDRRTAVLIPYHLWNNRGVGKMQVWIPLVNLPRF